MEFFPSNLLLNNKLNIHTNKDKEENEESSKFKIVTPGDIITDDPMYMRGHGTYLSADEIRSTVAGVVEVTNKLITAKSFRARYTGEIGDVVVGRIAELNQKRWKVDVNSHQDAVLMLSSINLPGGIQRRKSESDELKMRSFLAEGDLLVAEVQNFFQDGALSLHTRSLKYGKLRNGILVVVPSNLIQRSRSHFLNLSCGVDVILGLNGYCWVSKHVSPITTESDAYEIYSNENVAITDLERETIARVGNCIKALALHSVFLNDSNINYAFELSLSYSPKDILQLDIAQLIAQGTLARMQS